MAAINDPQPAVVRVEGTLTIPPHCVGESFATAPLGLATFHVIDGVTVALRAFADTLGTPEATIAVTTSLEGGQVEVRAPEAPEAPGEPEA